MKKIYSLLICLITFTTFSQGSINFDDDANWSATTPASYGAHTYTVGNFSATGLDILRNTVTAQDGFPGALGTYAVRLRNNATTEFTMTIASGGVGNFSFAVRRWDAAPDTNFAVETSTDNGVTWVASSTINATVTTDSDWKTVSGVVNSTNANIKVRIKSNGTTERIMVDDFSWTAPTTNPTLVISSPSNGTSFAPSTTSVSVNLSISNFNVANGTGDGHISYTLNGGTAVSKFDTTPIALTSLTPGMYTVVVSLVNNSNMPLNPAVTQTVMFEIANYIPVANIAALRADVTANGAGRYYQINSQALVTYARATRNQKYIEDTTAAILIDDVAGVITSPFVIGDGMTGVKGQTSLFSGLLQFTPAENVMSSSTGNTITPQVVTIADINANVDAYESELVRIANATFTGADGTAVFVVNTNYDLSDGAVIAFRAQFAEANYIGQVIPSGTSNRDVLVGRFNAVPQVVARNLNDITLSNNSFDKINGLAMYPNPVSGNILTISSDLNGDMNVAIFDILGKEVVSSKVVNNSIAIGDLNSGIYIVKITENGKTATRKLIVR